MYAEHLPLAIGTEERLVAQVQLQRIRTLIAEEEVEETYKLIEKESDVRSFLGVYYKKNVRISMHFQLVFKEIKTTFMLVDLLKLAIEAGNSMVFKKAKQLLIQATGAPNTTIYLGIAYLELNDKRGTDILMHIDYLPNELFKPIIYRQKEARRADIMHTLFTLLNNEKAPLELEYLLEQTIRQYGVFSLLTENPM